MKLNPEKTIWGWFLALVSVGTASILYIGSPLSASERTQTKLPPNHPDVPQAQRERKAALTEEASKSLPRSPRIEIKRKNYIDDYIFGKMEQDKIPHSGLATEQEFLRRVYLDITGRIPESEVVKKFLADKSPDKRDKLIDSLVQPERYAFAEEDPFVDKWAYWFSDLFGNNAGYLGEQGRDIFYDYIRASVRLNTAYNQWVTEMLTASALTNWYSGPSNFLARFHVDDGTGNQIAHEDTCDELAVASAKIFLGLNLECVACHNGAGHLDKINLWLTERKREELWREAAFFGNLQIYRPPPRRQEFTVLEDTTRGYDAEAYPIVVHTGYNPEAESFVRIQRWKADVTPTFILTGERPNPNENSRRAFARMLTQHPQFARATVNRIWAELMGVGIVDPPDNFDLARQDPKNAPPVPWTIQPTHPELLDALAKDFVGHNYDIRYVIQLITKSSAYQLSAVFDDSWKDTYARYFARRLIRRLSAEELFDAISQATGSVPEIGTRKTKYVLQARSPEELPKEIGSFLASFGQSDRLNTVKTLKGTMVQASLMLNSKVVKEKVKARPGGRLYELLNKEPPLRNDQIVEELFLSALSRYPTADEKKLAVSQIEKYRTQGAEDVLWALLNKMDFIFNY
jgi:hypothetical protein